jgi:hypothetical protein
MTLKLYTIDYDNEETYEDYEGWTVMVFAENLFDAFQLLAAEFTVNLTRYHKMVLTVKDKGESSGESAGKDGQYHKIHQYEVQEADHYFTSVWTIPERAVREVKKTVRKELGLYNWRYLMAHPEHIEEHPIKRGICQDGREEI